MNEAKSSYFCNRKFPYFLFNNKEMNRKILTIMAAAMFSASAAMAVAPGEYTVTLPLTEDEDGLTAYITDFDSGAKLDSCVVTDGKAVFTGKLQAPTFARIILDGNRAGMLVLEEGDIVVGGQRRIGSGSPTNDAFGALLDGQAALVEHYKTLAEDDEAGKAAVQSDYEALAKKALTDNAANPLGYYLFLQEAYNWDLPEFNRQLEAFPQFASSKRVQTLRQGLLNKEETSPGHMFKDFEVTYDGQTHRLSDYVGKGKYTLVDFWASWCGPCIRETKVIKQLYNDYADKGLEVLGVAVWDEPANTLRAIEQHQLPWKQIINAQTIPTDIYGIPAIPCIILFDPDGKIVSRDKQDEALIADVKAAMEPAN